MGTTGLEFVFSVGMLDVVEMIEFLLCLDKSKMRLTTDLRLMHFPFL